MRKLALSHDQSHVGLQQVEACAVSHDQSHVGLVTACARQHAASITTQAGGTWKHLFFGLHHTVLRL